MFFPASVLQKWTVDQFLPHLRSEAEPREHIRGYAFLRHAEAGCTITADPVDLDPALDIRAEEPFARIYGPDGYALASLKGDDASEVLAPAARLEPPLRDAYLAGVCIGVQTGAHRNFTEVSAVLVRPVGLGDVQ